MGRAHQTVVECGQQLEHCALQLQSAKQLSVRGDDDGGEAHCDCANAHGKIESPVDENPRCDRDGDKVVGGRPNQILDHLSVGGTREFDRPNIISWIVAHEHDSSRMKLECSYKTKCMVIAKRVCDLFNRTYRSLSTTSSPLVTGSFGGTFLRTSRC